MNLTLGKKTSSIVATFGEIMSIAISVFLKLNTSFELVDPRIALGRLVPMGRPPREISANS